jgi:hypothetical protein
MTRVLALGTLLVLVTALAVACGSETAATTTVPATPTTATTATTATPAADCVHAFEAYRDALLENDPAAAEGPLQKATTRECSRADWLTVAEDFTDSVVLADPETVLDAFCGSREGKACSG